MTSENKDITRWVGAMRTADETHPAVQRGMEIADFSRTIILGDIWNRLDAEVDRGSLSGLVEESQYYSLVLQSYWRTHLGRSIRTGQDALAQLGAGAKLGQLPHLNVNVNGINWNLTEAEGMLDEAVLEMEGKRPDGRDDVRITTLPIVPHFSAFVQRFTSTLPLYPRNGDVKYEVTFDVNDVFSDYRTKPLTIEDALISKIVRTETFEDPEGQISHASRQSTLTLPYQPFRQR